MHRSASGHKKAGRASVSLLFCAFAMLMPSVANAVPLSTLEDKGLDHTFGSYAPRGDCSREPRVIIDKHGITFRANGREHSPAKVEYAPSFYGQMDVGSLAVFYPFPVSSDDFGPVLMFVNDENRRGVIRFEHNHPPRQLADPFHSAFTAAGPFTLCAGATTAPMPERPQSATLTMVRGIPAEWNNLASLIGKYPGNSTRDDVDLFDEGAVASALNAKLGAKMSALRTNLSVASPLQRVGKYFYLSGNAPQQGGIEQAYVMIDPTRRSVQVGLWERGKLTVFPLAGGERLPVPPEIEVMLDNSPPETAVPLPGTPWEVVPVQGRASIAYVSAAASPNIESLSLYCENGRAFMAMLLNKSARGSAATMTWSFSGRLVSIPVQRVNAQGTQWIGELSETQLIPLLMQQNGTVMLRINGRSEGEASLENAAAVLRNTMRGCARI